MHNGAMHIGGNIERILAEIAAHNLTGVEIVVSDNFSADDTQSVVKGYIEKYPGLIKYSKNSANLGFDANVLKLCDMAKGKFIHIMGNDDFFHPDGLTRLLDALKKTPSLGVVVLSNDFLFPDGYVLTRKGGDEKFFPRDVYFSDATEFMRAVSQKIWYVSNTVFLRESYLALRNSPELKFNNWWIHIHLLLLLAKKGPLCLFLGEEGGDICVAVRVGAQTWKTSDGAAQIYYDNLKTYAQSLSLGYAKVFFEEYKKTFMRSALRDITFYRFNSLSANLKLVKEYFKYYKKQRGLLF